jgi:hypothetical protein
VCWRSALSLDIVRVVLAGNGRRRATSTGGRGGLTMCVVGTHYNLHRRNTVLGNVARCDERGEREGARGSTRNRDRQHDASEGRESETERSSGWRGRKQLQRSAWRMILYVGRPHQAVVTIPATPRRRTTDCICRQYTKHTFGALG